MVLNWCGERDTIACIESLEQSTYAKTSLLLVDNASPDGSGERLRQRFPDVPYLQTGANLGYAGGNNRGFDHALANDADWVLVLNNDTVVDPHCIEWLVRTAENTGAALVAPKILYYDAPDTIWFGGGDFSPMRALGLHRHEGARDVDAAAPEPITFATGCCFLIKADALRALGGFDESYFAYVEDVELSLRLERAGLRLMYEPRARVLHKIPVGPAPETPFQIRQRDRNRRRLARAHFHAMQRVVFAAWFYPTRLIHFIRYALRGSRPQAQAILAGMFGSLSAVSVGANEISTRLSRRET